MPTHNPNNERIKRQYFTHLRHVTRHSEATVDAAAKALSRFEADTKFRISPGHETAPQRR